MSWRVGLRGRSGVMLRNPRARENLSAGTWAALPCRQRSGRWLRCRLDAGRVAVVDLGDPRGTSTDSAQNGPDEQIRYCVDEKVDHSGDGVRGAVAKHANSFSDEKYAHTAPATPSAASVRV